MAWSPPDTAFPLRFPLVVFFFCAAACDAKAKGCDWKSVKTNHQAAAVTFLRFLLRYVSCVDVATAFRVAPLMSLLILFFCLFVSCFVIFWTCAWSSVFVQDSFIKSLYDKIQPPIAQTGWDVVLEGRLLDLRL